MSKLKVLFSLAILLVQLIVPTSALAVTVNTCSGPNSNYISGADFPEQVDLNAPINVSVTFSNFVQSGRSYYIRVTDEATVNSANSASPSFTFDAAHPYSAATATQHFTAPGINRIGTYKVKVVYPGLAGTALGENEVCTLGSVAVVDQAFNTIACTISIPPVIHSGDTPSVTVNAPAAPSVQYNFFLVPKGTAIPSGLMNQSQLASWYDDPTHHWASHNFTSTTTFTLPNNIPNNPYVAVVTAQKDVGTRLIDLTSWGRICSAQDVTVSQDSTAPPVVSTPAPTTPPLREGPTGPPATAGGVKCSAGGQDGVLTAIGCVPTEPGALVEGILKFATGAGGGIALLLMIAGAFRMITSSGNPENVKKGQEQFSSAIIGLLFIIFAVLLMQIIGVDILGIPIIKP